ncbi:hypothetical protein RA268_28075, partial [Pseudomonas syringae pv. tagetis]
VWFLWCFFVCVFLVVCVVVWGFVVFCVMVFCFLLVLVFFVLLGVVFGVGGGVFWWVVGVGLVVDVVVLGFGVVLIVGATLPAVAGLLLERQLWPRYPPVRFGKSVPTRWRGVGIKAGRDRQVRRLTAAVGLPTLR